MADPFDIIELPWQRGRFGRRALVDALDRAGRPWCNDVDRLYAAQLDARLAFENGTGSPADDPRRPNLYPLAHVRLVAADITPTPALVAALAAQGLVRPYDYEPWHWQLPGDVRIYPLVTSIPTSAYVGATPFEYPANQGDDGMTLYLRPTSGTDLVAKGNLYINDRDGAWRGITNLESLFYDALAAEKKISIQEISGSDMSILFALNGVCEQPAATPISWGNGQTLGGLGAPTGRIKFPGTEGVRGDWHYPRVTVG